MSLRDGVISTQILEKTPSHALLDPDSTLLASMLESRRNMDSQGRVQGDLPQGISRNLRPPLPRIDHMALRLYTERKVVESFPLLYTMLAMAQPN